jgi:hypothetical protein
MLVMIYSYFVIFEKYSYISHFRIRIYGHLKKFRSDQPHKVHERNGKVLAEKNSYHDRGSGKKIQNWLLNHANIYVKLFLIFLFWKKIPTITDCSWNIFHPRNHNLLSQKIMIGLCHSSFWPIELFEWSFPIGFHF